MFITNYPKFAPKTNYGVCNSRLRIILVILLFGSFTNSFAKLKPHVKKIVTEKNWVGDKHIYSIIVVKQMGLFG